MTKPEFSAPPLRFASLLLTAVASLVVSQAAQAADDDEVTIVLVGDVGLNRNAQRVEPDGVRRGSFYPWAETTSLIAGEIDGDLNFMNAETVITDRNDHRRDTKGQRGPFNFRTHPNGIRHLASRGFNVMSLANNHSMDYGLPGLEETLKHIGKLENEDRVIATGIGMNREEAGRPRQIDVKGAKIAFGAIGILTNNLARHRAGPDKPGQIAYRFDDDFAEIRKRLTGTPADYRILSIHYGIEGQVRTDDKQIAEWRHQAALDDNIDLVVGHHAHVVRGVERVGNSLIFYGLGNFLHHGTSDISRRGICRDYGLMARVHLKKSDDGTLSMRAVEAIPVTDTHYRTRPLSGERGRERIHVLNYLASKLDDPADGAQGMRFTPRRDGTGLYCEPGAQGDGGRIGELCKDFVPPPRIPAHLRRPISVSCRS